MLGKKGNCLSPVCREWLSLKPSPNQFKASWPDIGALTRNDHAIIQRLFIRATHPSKILWRSRIAKKNRSVLNASTSARCALPTNCNL